jgi:hypothetical protein
MKRAFFCVAAFLPAVAHGFGAGVFGYSGKPPAQTCNECHSGGAAPTVTLSGPVALAVGESATYAIDIVTGASTAAVGFDIAADQGALAVVPGQTNASWLNSGEITHTKDWPKGKEVRLMFQFTAPAAAGTATIYATGLHSDGVDDPGGDQAASTTLAVTVGGTAAPLDLAGVDAISAATEKPAPDAGAHKDEPTWGCHFGGGATSGAALITAAILAVALLRRRREN